MLELESGPAGERGDSQEKEDQFLSTGPWPGEPQEENPADDSQAPRRHDPDQPGQNRYADAQVTRREEAVDDLERRNAHQGIQGRHEQEEIPDPAHHPVVGGDQRDTRGGGDAGRRSRSDHENRLDPPALADSVEGGPTRAEEKQEHENGLPKCQDME